MSFVPDFGNYSLIARYRGRSYRLDVGTRSEIRAQLLGKIFEEYRDLGSQEIETLDRCVLEFCEKKDSEIRTAREGLKAAREKADLRSSQSWEERAYDYVEVGKTLEEIATTLALPDKDMSPREKYNIVSEIAYKHFFSNGKFYYDALTQERYWFDGDSKVLYALSRDTFGSFLSDRLGVNREDPPISGSEVP